MHLTASSFMTVPALAEARDETERLCSEYQALLLERTRDGNAEGTGAPAVGGSNSWRNPTEEPDRRNARFSAEEREPAHATSAVERARAEANALK